MNFNLGYDLIKKKVIDIYPSLGLRFQQTKLRVTKTTNPNQPSYNFGEEDMKIYKKPAIALNGLLTIRLNTEFITFSVTGGYSLDLTSNKWLYKNSSLQNSPSYKATGFIGIASLGFVFHD